MKTCRTCNQTKPAEAYRGTRSACRECESASRREWYAAQAVKPYQRPEMKAYYRQWYPAITHCDNCGCDWMDNGLNPIGCPYCKPSAESEALRAEVAEWKRVAAAQAELHGEAEERAEQLAEDDAWCAECGVKLENVRPGKHQHPTCSQAQPLTDEALLRQALEALELRCGTNADERKELIPALRERLGGEGMKERPHPLQRADGPVANGCCHYCDKTNDLRPYGPKGAMVCFGCAMSTPERKAETEHNFAVQLDAAGPVAMIDGTEVGPYPAKHAKVQVEYYALRNEPPEIGFLKDDAQRAIEGEQQ